MSIYDILKKIRSLSVTERQKGAMFEKLMQRWLKSDPRYCNTFEKVWLWEEFPAKAEFGGKDTGIDLVAVTPSPLNPDFEPIQLSVDNNARIATEEIMDLVRIL